MKRMLNRIALLLAVVTLLGVPIYGQQVQELTRGTGGVGRLVVGLGTPGAATLVNGRVTLTNAQVLDLGDTAVTVAAAPGAGYVIDVLDGMLIFNYTAAYTVGSTADAKLWYTNRTGIAASNLIEFTGFLDASADAIIAFSGTPDDTRPSANTAIVIQAPSAEVTGGNASNQVFVDVTYVIRRTGL